MLALDYVLTLTPENEPRSSAGLVHAGHSALHRSVRSLLLDGRLDDYEMYQLQQSSKSFERFMLSKLNNAQTIKYDCRSKPT